MVFPFKKDTLEIFDAYMQGNNLIVHATCRYFDNRKFPTNALTLVRCHGGADPSTEAPVPGA